MSVHFFQGNDALGGIPPKPRLGRQPVIRQMLTTFDTGHGFTRQSAGGVQANDMSIRVMGSQSLRLTTVGDGVSVFSRSGSVGPFDLTGRQLRTMIRVDRPDELGDITIQISSDGFTNYCSWQIDGNQLRPLLCADEWVTTTLAWGNAIVNGSPARDSIDRLQVRVTDRGNGTPVNAWFQFLELIDAPAGAGVVSLTFDDGRVSQFTNAAPVMDRYGYGGTAYVIADLLGAIDSVTSMSLAHAQELEQQHGWEIAAHSCTLADHDLRFTALTDQQLHNNICQLQSFLLQNGFSSGVDHLAYPGGDFNTRVLAIVRQYFASARTIQGRTLETYPPGDPFRLRTFNVLADTTPETVSAAVTKAIAGGYWLILTFHSIIASPANSNEYAISDFTAIIDDLSEQGATVRVVGDVVRNGF